MSQEEEKEQESYIVKNSELTVTVSKKPHCQVKFDIKVTPEGTQAAYQTAVKNVKKEVSIPGFRKGRAPDSFILTKYASHIHSEFVDLVLQIGFREALTLTDLHPLKDGTYKRPIVHECSIDKGAHFVVEFEIRPLISALSIDDIPVETVKPSPITEDDRKNAFYNFSLNFMAFEPIEDRAVEENDYINLTLTLLEDLPRKVAENRRLEVTSKVMPEWLIRKIVGRKAGEDFEGMTEQNSDEEKDLEFQSIPFVGEIHSIWKGVLPVIDDELAKKVGLSSVEDLHQKINQRLEEQVKNETHELQIRAIENALIEKYPLDLPQSSIDSSAKHRIENYLESHENTNLSPEFMEELKNAMTQNSIRSLRLSLLLHKIATDHHIEVTDQDFSKELNLQLSLYRSGQTSVDFSDKDEKAVRDQIRNIAFDRKVKDFLIHRLVKNHDLLSESFP